MEIFGKIKDMMTLSQIKKNPHVLEFIKRAKIGGIDKF